MGYTHYWYRVKEIEQTTFNKIVSDFKQFLPLFKAMDIKLGDGAGEGEPEINENLVCFNGSRYCGHKKNSSLVIPWPSKTVKPGVATNSEKAESGSWFAGVEIDQRTCDGDCSYETFDFPRMVESDREPTDKISYYEIGHRPVYNRVDVIGKYFNFTKTAFRPYDLAVNVFLIIAKHHLGKNLVVRSDGELPQWQEAFIMVKYALGYEDFEFNTEAPVYNPSQEVQIKPQTEQNTAIPRDSLEQIKLIRKLIKKELPSVRVQNGRGTAWGWVDIWAKNVGDCFTEKERQILKDKFGLNSGANCANISPDEREYYLKKWLGMSTKEDEQKHINDIYQRSYD